MIVIVSLVFLLTYSACANADRYDKKQFLTQYEQLQTKNNSLIIGTFELIHKGIADGDTIRVKGLKKSIRLLGIDTEEKFRFRKDKILYNQGWNIYLKHNQRKDNRPMKVPTPMGNEASKWAEDFFRDVKTVQLERDDPRVLLDIYQRYLAYVIVYKNGQRINYNVEAVRAGMTPYFPKYGHSTRFKNEFLKAQQEARAAKRGIWNPNKEHYPDYPRRLRWWTQRGDFLGAFEQEAEGKENYIIYKNSSSLIKIKQFLGKTVHLTGLVGEIIEIPHGPIKVELSVGNTQLALVFWDKKVLAQTGLQKHRGEFIRLQGKITQYHNKKRESTSYQIHVYSPAQIVLSPPLPS